MTTHHEYKTFRNVNNLNEELADDVQWELCAVSWVDVDVEVNKETGEMKTFHNPVMLMRRDVEFFDEPD